jgi:hypothetical protein
LRLILQLYLQKLESVCNAGRNAGAKKRVVYAKNTLPYGRVSAFVFDEFHLTERVAGKRVNGFKNGVVF